MYAGPQQCFFTVVVLLNCYSGYNLMTKAEILFRVNRDTEEEMQAAIDAGWSVTTSRNNTSAPLMVGRYSVLPYYKELETDLAFSGAKLINSYQQHNYIASFDYYEDLKQFTPKTWFELSDVPDNAGPYVIKGCTNSRKQQWDTMMFANTKRAAVEIACELKRDSLIGDQNIIVRKFIPLEKIDEGINGLPMSNEWRFFFYKQTMLSHGFYWVSTDLRGSMDTAGLMFAQKIANIVAEHVNFFVLDIAKTLSGDWIVVELNDGQMSGLSDNDPKVLYTNLKSTLQETI